MSAGLHSECSEQVDSLLAAAPLAASKEVRLVTLAELLATGLVTREQVPGQPEQHHAHCASFYMDGTPKPTGPGAERDHGRPHFQVLRISNSRFRLTMVYPPAHAVVRKPEKPRSRVPYQSFMRYLGGPAQQRV